MDVFIAEYNGIPVRFLKLPDKGLLLNTADLCKILRITNRSTDEDLGLPWLDLVSAVSIASTRSIDFSQWLNETFGGYKMETSDRATWDHELNSE